jgi:uncharacterized protein YjbJ (UPF0337 family)
MFNDDNGSGASNLLTFIFGIAIGVAGTIIYAAANEDQFHHAVKKTRQLKGSAQDALGDYADEASAKVKVIKDKVQDGVDSVSSKVKSAVSDVADEANSKVQHAKKELSS